MEYKEQSNSLLLHPSSFQPATRCAKAACVIGNPADTLLSCSPSCCQHRIFFTLLSPAHQPGPATLQALVNAPAHTRACYSLLTDEQQPATLKALMQVPAYTHACYSLLTDVQTAVLRGLVHAPAHSFAPAHPREQAYNLSLPLH